MPENLVENQANPYESPDKRVGSPQAQIRSKLKSIGIISAIVIVLLCFFLQATRRCAEEAARRMICQQNIRDLGLGSHSFNNDHVQLPPITKVDRNGIPFDSWYTKLLPSTDKQDVFYYVNMKQAKPRPSPEF